MYKPIKLPSKALKSVVLVVLNKIRNKKLYIVTDWIFLYTSNLCFVILMYENTLLLFTACEGDQV